MKALIDGDILVYKSGFASQSTVDGVVIPERFSNALFSLNRMISEIEDNLMADSLVFYLTAKDNSNFRFDVAKTLPYKGNRKSEKPYHYEALRKYLIKQYKAEEVFGIEADDAMSIAQMGSDEETCIVTIDKDLDMVPGLHYNIDTKEVYTVSDPGSLVLAPNRRKIIGRGLIWFYAQLLLGDKSSDNIPGLKGCGPVKTIEILKDTTDEKDMAQKVLRAYTETMPENEAKDRILEIADLLWMLRKPDERKSQHLETLL